MIGGGAIGTGIAFRLAEAGVRDIVLLERDELGHGSTGKAAARRGTPRVTHRLIRSPRHDLQPAHLRLPLRVGGYPVTVTARTAMASSVSSTAQNSAIERATTHRMRWW